MAGGATTAMDKHADDTGKEDAVALEPNEMMFGAITRP
jgi:hypothetical protein